MNNMNVEIERKFLVKKELIVSELTDGEKIIQGYICNDPQRVVRVRRRADRAYLTIKGATSSNGLSRYEFEKEITVSEADELFKLCDSKVISKTRYLVSNKNHTWEVDIFDGALDGLIIAEIELSDENESFETPLWISREVTGEDMYYNNYLVNCKNLPPVE